MERINITLPADLFEEFDQEDVLKNPDFKKVFNICKSIIQIGMFQNLTKGVTAKEIGGFEYEYLKSKTEDIKKAFEHAGHAEICKSFLIQWSYVDKAGGDVIGFSLNVSFYRNIDECTPFYSLKFHSVHGEGMMESNGTP
jgi:hypothetical protein